MASSTMCFSGFSRDEITPIQQQFEQANAESGQRWTLVPEADAQVLVIDMDSMYGHMTWLKAHSGGKTTVGLTAGERSETDHVLRRPVSVQSLRTLLDALSAPVAHATVDSPLESGVPAERAEPASPSGVSEPLEAAKVAEPAVPVTVATVAPIPAAIPAPAATPAPSPAPVVAPAQAPVTAPAQPAIADAPAAPRSSADYIAAVTTGQQAAMPALTVPHALRVSDFLPAGRLSGPVRLQLPGAPALVLDPATQTYAGSSTLKPLLPYVQAVLSESDFVSIGAADFEAIKVATGGAQPFMRLLWLCGLTLGNGRLLPGHDPARKYLLTKWPQIEREFPKHFRIATVMMKGPALVREIVEQSGVVANEVIEFINAGLLAGSVVIEGSTSQAGDVARAAAVLARPRPE